MKAKAAASDALSKSRAAPDGFWPVESRVSGDRIQDSGCRVYSLELQADRV